MADEVMKNHHDLMSFPLELMNYIYFFTMKLNKK